MPKMKRQRATPKPTAMRIRAAIVPREKKGTVDMGFAACAALLMARLLFLGGVFLGVVGHLVAALEHVHGRSQ